MTRSNALITIAVLTALAGGLAWAFGAYGVIFAGAAGLFAAFGVYFTEPERELSRQSYTLRPLDDPTLASQYEAPEGGTRERPWLWKSAVAAYALALIVLGFALSAGGMPAEEHSEGLEPTGASSSLCKLAPPDATLSQYRSGEGRPAHPAVRKTPCRRPA